MWPFSVSAETDLLQKLSARQILQRLLGPGLQVPTHLELCGSRLWDGALITSPLVESLLVSCAELFFKSIPGTGGIEGPCPQGRHFVRLKQAPPSINQRSLTGPDLMNSTAPGLQTGPTWRLIWQLSQTQLREKFLKTLRFEIRHSLRICLHFNSTTFSFYFV